MDDNIMPGRMIDMLGRNQKGMTLIEIVIVIAIIATLASVAIPTLITSLDMQEVKATKSSMGALKTAMLNYYKDVGKFPRVTTDQKEWAITHYGLKKFDDIDSLLFNPFNPESNNVQEYIDSHNWKGPYIMSSFKSDDYKYDSWGHEFLYDPYYGMPGYMMGMTFGAFGFATTAEHGGAGITSTNAVLLVSQGKVEGYGRKKNEEGKEYTGTYGLLNTDKIVKLKPSEMYPNDDDDYIPMIVDPRAEKLADQPIDDEKTDITKAMLTNIKSSVISFVKDLGVVQPSNSGNSSATNVAPIAIDSGYFSQFPNSLAMLVNYFFDDPNGSYNGGQVKDRLPFYRAGICSSFDDITTGDYAQMGWKGPYYLDAGVILDNGSIPTYDITYEGYVDAWGNVLQVPFAGDDLWTYYGAVYDPNFGNNTTGNAAYDATYNRYSGILISGGANRKLNSAIQTKTYLDPSGTVPVSGVPPEMRQNDDIWVLINKNEVYANFANSRDISNSKTPVTVNTGLNIWFKFPGTDDTINYCVDKIAVIHPDVSTPYNFKVRMFHSMNPNSGYKECYELTTPTDQGFTKDNLSESGDSANPVPIIYVPVGTCWVYALIKAETSTNIEIESFDNGCDPPPPALSSTSRWGQYLDNSSPGSKSYNPNIKYAVFGAPLEVTNGSGTLTVTIHVNLAKAKQLN
jgi:prepilin-type N-terminal cleavage/methylation domain-containing protein